MTRDLRFTPNQRATAAAVLEERRAKFPAPAKTPRTLPADAIVTLPEVFQPRDSMDIQLVGELAGSIRAGRTVAPLLVTWAPAEDGSECWVVIDGHHRLLAYYKAGRKRVPVEVFKGTVEEAMRQGVQLNGANKARLSPQARSEAAWRRVCERAKGGAMDTLKSISQDTGASIRTVKSMSAAYQEIWDNGAGTDPACWTWAAVLFRNRVGGAASMQEAEKAQQRAESLKATLLRGGFKPSQHIPALVEALALIDPALPNRVADAIRKADDWGGGGEDRSEPIDYPFTSDDDEGNPDF